MAKFSKVTATEIAYKLKADGWEYSGDNVALFNQHARLKIEGLKRHLPGDPQAGAFISTGQDNKISVIFEKHTSVMGADPNTKVRLPLDRPLTHERVFRIQDKSGLKFG